jgi:hypothetical protein
MRDIYGDDRLAIEMLGEADLMEEGNRGDLLKNEDEIGEDELWGANQNEDAPDGFDEATSKGNKGDDLEVKVNTPS